MICNEKRFAYTRATNGTILIARSSIDGKHKADALSKSEK
jgi:hypothetical protein